MKRKPDIETVAAFFTHTQRLLIDAKNKRDRAILQKAAERVSSQRFEDLPEDAQDGLMELYGAAMNSCGMSTP